MTDPSGSPAGEPPAQPWSPFPVQDWSHLPTDAVNLATAVVVVAIAVSMVRGLLTSQRAMAYAGVLTMMVLAFAALIRDGNRTIYLDRYAEIGDLIVGTALVAAAVIAVRDIAAHDRPVS